MTTKTDFHAIMELKKRYTPAYPGIVSFDEMEAIREALEISDRNDVELRNARDMVVMLYGQWSDSLRQKNNIPAATQMMDTMSAITHVIDAEKSTRGLPV